MTKWNEEDPVDLDELKDRLVRDEEYYYRWQANIAIEFCNEYKKVMQDDFGVELISISDQAAKNFLDRLIRS